MRINQLRVVAACRSTSLLATSTGEPIVTSYDTSPWQVQLALLLLAANLILGFVRMAIQQGWTHPEKAAMGLMLVGTVSVYWLYGLAIRLNWLRWWTLVSTLLGVPLTGYAIYQIQTPWVAAVAVYDWCWRLERVLCFSRHLVAYGTHVASVSNHRLERTPPGSSVGHGGSPMTINSHSSVLRDGAPLNHIVRRLRNPENKEFLAVSV